MELDFTRFSRTMDGHKLTSLAFGIA